MAIIFFTIFLIRDARNATMAHLTPSQTQVYRETERSIVLKSFGFGTAMAMVMIQMIFKAEFAERIFKQEKSHRELFYTRLAALEKKQD